MNLITHEKIISGDLETPISLYAKYAKDNIGFLLESMDTNHPNGRYSFISTKPYMTIKAYKGGTKVVENGIEIEYKENPLDVVEKYMKKFNIENTTELSFAGGAVGALGYDMIRYYENLPDNNEDTIGTPDVDLQFIKEYIAYDHTYHKIHIVVLEEDNVDGKNRAQNRIEEIEESFNSVNTLRSNLPKFNIEFHSNLTKEEYISIVNKAKKYIYDGDIFQCVASQRFSGYKNDATGFELYRKLRQVNPSPYMYYFKMEDYEIVGSSPEMLVKIEDDIIQNCPIAGTRKIAENEEENRKLEKDLLEDEKERAEHIMLVDLGRNDMGKVARIDTVKVEKFMEVQRYSHVMHLTSLLTGFKKEDCSMYEVLMSFLPAGTLSGAPKIRAMEIIDELETLRRGIYGGAIGYFGYNDNMDMCIAIRTMIIKNDIVNIQAGGGIVYDSVPELEYEETLNKAKALMTAINM